MLHRWIKQDFVSVWLSKPIQTLRVPYLVPDGTDALLPASVLLLLAGTGVVALSQVLHNRDPYNKVGISIRKWHQLHVPIDLVLSSSSSFAAPSFLIFSLLLA